MTAISLLSTFAVIVGLAGILPQLSRMLPSRSAAGQSAFGWSLGAAGNLSMLYVNLVGYHATILAVNNLIALLLCVVAMSIILWLNRHEVAEAPGAGGPHGASDAGVPGAGHRSPQRGGPPRERRRGLGSAAAGVSR